MPDRGYMLELFRELCSFWKLVQTDMAPEMTDRDFVLVRDKDVLALFREHEEAKRLAKHWLDHGDLEKAHDWTKVLTNLKRQIIDHDKVRGRRVRCGDYRLNLLVERDQT